MLSMTHMVVVFVIVLIVFGPQKLPELARGFGKLMAEFRKASTDFKSAFEQEMRDLDRQALQVQRKKEAEAAVAAAGSGAQPATLAAPAGAEIASASLDADTRATEALVVTPCAESVPRATVEVSETESPETESPEAESPATESPEAKPQEPTNGASAEPITETFQAPSHDQQQPV
ncbi:MAG: twin-arginine translocase TatA/TatE family subunit [Candidatus Acidiferrum sp.]